jgi:hypothetical protein
VTASTCPACAKPLTARAARCANCGLVLDEHHRCPHCHAVAELEISADARFVCAVCGGARIPIDDPAIPRSSEQIELLKVATLARSGRAAWRVVAFVVGGFGVFSLLVLWLAIAVADPPLPASLVASLAVLAPFGFATYAWLRARRHAARLEPALEQAWVFAARDIARARGGEIDARTLAKLTRIGERDADRLLSRMSAENLLTSSVTSEGSLQYTLLESSSPAEVEKRLPAAR